MITLRIRLLCCLSVFPLLLTGAEKGGIVPEWVDRLIDRFTKGSAVDSCYIARDTFRFIVKPKLTGSFGRYEFRWKDSENGLALRSAPQMKIGVNLTYRHLTLGLSTSIDPLLGRKSKKEMDYSLSSYGNRLGGELFYTTSNNYSLHNGQHKILHTSLRCFESQRLQGSAYYVFNHRRFSYPCTITQSYYQRRSRIPRKTSYLRIGLNFSYAHNWVLGRRWTLHASLLGTVPVYEKGTIDYPGHSEKIHYNILNTNPALRIGLLYSARRHFGGFSLSNNFLLIRHSSLDISDLYFRARLYYGMRF